MKHDRTHLLRQFVPMLLLGLSVLTEGCASQLVGSPQHAITQPAPAAVEDVQQHTAAPSYCESLSPGVSYWQIHRPGEKPFVAHIVQIDVAHSGLRFRVTPADTSRGMEHRARLTSEFLSSTGAILAINASYFLPFKGGSKGADDYYPHVGDPVGVSGAAIAGGNTLSPIDTTEDIRVNSIVCFADNRVTILDGQNCPPGTTDGVAAGPLLLKAGKPAALEPYDAQYAFNPHPRTAMGLSSDACALWIVVVDGRQKGYSTGATLPELTALFRDLGASDAINLDGGGSSTLVAHSLEGTPRLLNRPIHTGIPGRERPVANHIGLYR